MKLHGTAATVVLLRDSADGLQVLLLERPRHRGSFAGAWVFPGGVVDPQDAAGLDDGGERDDVERDDVEITAARRAGVRETVEETGLRLAEPDLVRLSRWVPPPESPRRYRTEFFLAAAPAGEVVLSPQEHVDAAWLTPAEAFRRQREGRMELVPPTWVTLHGLLGRATVAEALAGAAASEPETYVTRRLPGQGPEVMVWAGDAEYPGPAAYPGDAAYPGPAEHPGDAEYPGTAEPGPGTAPDPSRRHRLVRDERGWSYQRSG